MSSPREVSWPPECGIAQLRNNADLADAFAIDLPRDASLDIDTLARAIFGHQPGWVRGLMRIRDTAMGQFGVKTSVQLRRHTGDKSEKVGFFRVYERRDRELILGEDDSHLDFRVSVLVRSKQDGSGDEAVVSTVVHCHNRLGRLYLRVIRPFHRLVVPADLRSAARHGWNAPQA